MEAQMSMEQSIEWVSELRKKIPLFLDALRGNAAPGFYHYSLSGDIEHDKKWGLGNAVFAAKIYYMLGILNEELCNSISQFILKFQNKDGYIFDPLVEQRSRARRIWGTIRSLNSGNLWNQQTRRAETRQSVAALRCLGRCPNLPFMHIPYTYQGIKKYIHRLNWKEPWGAASHVSHLLFFLNSNYQLYKLHQEDTQTLIQSTLDLVNQYQQSDGSWYDSNGFVSLRQKVNAAMKMMTAYDAVGRNDFSKAEALIDLCLSATNDNHACDNFNVVCVLYHCLQKTDYRRDEIEQFALKRLEIYKNYYWPEYGGFSFFKGKANDIYYGAKISRGKPEPDIHGTVLFLWGIVLISKIIGFDGDLGFKLPYT